MAAQHTGAREQPCRALGQAPGARGSCERFALASLPERSTVCRALLSAPRHFGSEQDPKLAKFQPHELEQAVCYSEVVGQDTIVGLYNMCDTWEFVLLDAVVMPRVCIVLSDRFAILLPWALVFAKAYTVLGEVSTAIVDDVLEHITVRSDATFCRRGVRNRHLACLSCFRNVY